MSARNLVLAFFNQNLYLDRYLGLSKKLENVWCAMCAYPFGISQVLDIELYPSTLNEFYTQHERKHPKQYLVGKNKNNIVWDKVSEVYPELEVKPFLWDKHKHYDKSIIEPYAIVSVDGNRIKKGYQSHFLMFHHWKEEFGKITNAYCFDPYYGRWDYVVPHYGRDINKVFHTIINIRKRSA